MKKNRYGRAPTTLLGSEPFASAEEAWFWFVRCQKARDAGMRFIRDMGKTPRPCFPDDIFRAVKSLKERRIIREKHVQVMNVYGHLERPPDPRCEEEARSYVLWDQALDRLATVLKTKDIVR